MSAMTPYRIAGVCKHYDNDIPSAPKSPGFQESVFIAIGTEWVKFIETLGRTPSGPHPVVVFGA